MEVPINTDGGLEVLMIKFWSYRTSNDIVYSDCVHFMTALIHVYKYY